MEHGRDNRRSPRRALGAGAATHVRHGDPATRRSTAAGSDRADDTEPCIPAPPASLYLFDALEPLFVQQLGLTHAAWVDAWEIVELLRMAAPLATHHRGNVTSATEQVYATIHGSHPPDAGTWSEAVADLAALVRVHPAHTFVSKTSTTTTTTPRSRASAFSPLFMRAGWAARWSKRRSLAKDF
jgi:hypothetical protein